jgi:hypothetical protein
MRYFDNWTIDHDLDEGAARCGERTPQHPNWMNEQKQQVRNESEQNAHRARAYRDRLRGAACGNPKRDYISDMMRPTFLLVALFGLMTACSQTVEKPVLPPPPAEQPRTHLDERPGVEEPTLIAPPPQYGNKVVMAKAAAPKQARLD